MRFGLLPLEECRGAILAHAIHFGDGVLKKGRVLSDADVALMRDRGLTGVVAAKLEPGDVGEDAAAERVARAIAGPNLTVSAAFTGRVNLYAAADGVVDLDIPRLEALNLLDESVTVATLPAFTPVTSGQMVATVKIIPFAAPERVVAAAEALAAGPMIQVAPWLGLKAGLIQTVLPGTKPGVLDKTVTATGARLAAVGAGLAAERRVAHDVDAVAVALRELRAEGCGLLLIVGASAITDRRDVLPAGIDAAGGKVRHFGMPVDPGNLLLLAELEDTPVLGLPGCARSPKLNGFDWVLQRLAAGLRVMPADLMRMGIGGLLAEIPSRPLPRDRATAPPRAPRIHALVLAGGSSRRMGTNKLLMDLDGAPLILRAVDAALASQATAVTVVTGHMADRVREALAGRPVAFVHAPDHDDGLSATLKSGLRALPADADGVLVLLGDMPRVSPGCLDRLIAAYSPSDGRGICVPTFQGRRGNPVLWDRRHVEEMLTLTGDTGAKDLLRRHAEDVAEVEMPDDGILLDVDTPEALAALRFR